MKTQKLLFGLDARRKLAEGADIVAKAVVSTLGPRSHNVAINQEWPAPVITHDGVSVAERIRLKDSFQDMGAALIREAASKTNSEAGDGTTTATLLANTLIQEGMQLMGGLGSDGFVLGATNSMKLREDLDTYRDKILEKLKTYVVDGTSIETLQQVATISCANEELGELIAHVVQKVGKDGIIMLERNDGLESVVEWQEGMKFDNGYLSKYFVTDPDNLITEYQESYVLITDQAIADPHALVPILEKVAIDGGKPLIIIADDVRGDALKALAVTNRKRSQICVAVMAPEFGDRRKQMLEDIAILTGGNVMSSDLNRTVESAKLGDLGRLRHAVITQTTTMLTPLTPDAEDIKERTAAIRKQIDSESNTFRRQKLEERLSRLTSGVAFIKVGGGSLSEVTERYKRVEDAVNAAKASLAEGIIGGAGMTLYRIAEDLEAEVSKEEQNSAAYGLIQTMLRMPFRTILTNSGYDPDEVIKEIDERQTTEKEMIGFNVVDGQTHPLLVAGLVDPVKVTRLALINAISVAGIILTNDTLITDEEETDVQKMQIVT